MMNQQQQPPTTTGIQQSSQQPPLQTPLQQQTLPQQQQSLQQSPAQQSLQQQTALQQSQQPSIQQQQHLSSLKLKLFFKRELDEPDPLELVWRDCYEKIEPLLLNSTESEINNSLIEKASSSDSTAETKIHTEITIGLLYAILIAPTQSPLGPQYFKTLTFFTKDSLQAFCNLLKKMISDKFQKLNETPRQQVLWIVNELINTNHQESESVSSIILRHIYGGNLIQKNLSLGYSMLNIFLSHKSWLYSKPTFIPIVLYHYLRLIQDHINRPPPFNPSHLKDEVIFCLDLLKNKFQECLIIGRDLIRLLQYLSNKVPEFEQLWKDLNSKPSSFLNSYQDISQSMKTPTPKHFLQSRLSPEMEGQVLYILKEVKFGNQKRYQQWFVTKYLMTPESESLIPDIIRYICCVYHPPNHVLCSDIVPRWAIIGWLLKHCKSDAWRNYSKLSLFLDWLYYDPKIDSIMNIEPAILLMAGSVKKYADMTIDLVEYIIGTLLESYDPQRTSLIRAGINNSFQTLLEKCVVQSLNHVFPPDSIGPALYERIKQNFHHFLVAPPIHQQQQQQQQQKPLNSSMGSLPTNNKSLTGSSGNLPTNNIHHQQQQPPLKSPPLQPNSLHSSINKNLPPQPNLPTNNISSPYINKPSPQQQPIPPQQLLQKSPPLKETSLFDQPKQTTSQQQSTQQQPSQPTSQQQSTPQQPVQPTPQQPTTKSPPNLPTNNENSSTPIPPPTQISSDSSTTTTATTTESENVNKSNINSPIATSATPTSIPTTPTTATTSTIPPKDIDIVMKDINDEVEQQKLKSVQQSPSITSQSLNNSILKPSQPNIANIGNNDNNNIPTSQALPQQQQITQQPASNPSQQQSITTTTTTPIPTSTSIIPTQPPPSTIKQEEATNQQQSNEIMDLDENVKLDEEIKIEIPENLLILGSQVEFQPVNISSRFRNILNNFVEKVPKLSTQQQNEIAISFTNYLAQVLKPEFENISSPLSYFCNFQVIHHLFRACFRSTSSPLNQSQQTQQQINEQLLSIIKELYKLLPSIGFKIIIWTLINSPGGLQITNNGCTYIYPDIECDNTLQDNNKSNNSSIGKNSSNNHIINGNSENSNNNHTTTSTTINNNENEINNSNNNNNNNNIISIEEESIYKIEKLLESIQDNNLANKNLFLNYIKFKQSILGSEFSTSKFIDQVLIDCQEAQNEGIFNFLVPILYKYLPSYLVGSGEFLYFVISNITPRQHFRICNKISMGEFRVFGNELIKTIIDQSFKWESFEQNYMWQMLLAEDSVHSGLILKEYSYIIGKLDAYLNCEVLQNLSTKLKETKLYDDSIFTETLLLNDYFYTFTFNLFSFWLKNNTTQTFNYINNILDSYINNSGSGINNNEINNNSNNNNNNNNNEMNDSSNNNNSLNNNRRLVEKILYYYNLFLKKYNEEKIKWSDLIDYERVLKIFSKTSNSNLIQKYSNLFQLISPTTPNSAVSSPLTNISPSLSSINSNSIKHNTEIYENPKKRFKKD